MSLEITGKVVKILPLKTGEGKKGTWSSRQFLIEHGEQYPRKALFDTFGDKSDVVGNLKVGDTVKVSFALDANEYNDKWYPKINAWKIEKLIYQNEGSQDSSVSEQDAKEESEIKIEDTDEDNLPF
jgi:hypothetical protein